MIESIQELPVVLTNNTAKLTFSSDSIRTRSACQNNPRSWLCHQTGNPLYQVLGNGNCNCNGTAKYEVSFNANISGATAGTPVALALFEDDVIVPGTTMIATVTAAGDVENISFENTIEVCGRSNATLSIGSVSSVPDFTDLTGVGIDTQAPIVANATFSIEKIA